MMYPNGALCNGKTDAEAASVTLSGIIYSVKRPEDILQFVLWQARAAVTDLKHAYLFALITFTAKNYVYG